MSCEVFDKFLDKIVVKLTEENANNLNGTPTYDFDQYRENLPEGLCLLSTNIEGVGYKIVGVSFTNPFEFNRMYIVAANNGIVMFLDAMPESVTGLGLEYDFNTKTIKDPKTGNVVLKDFMD